jgi:hypothetical protein
MTRSQTLITNEFRMTNDEWRGCVPVGTELVSKYAIRHSLFVIFSN